MCDQTGLHVVQVAPPFDDRLVWHAAGYVVSDGIAWPPKGRSIFFSADRAGTNELLRYSGGHATVLSALGTRWVGPVASSPDGKSLAFEEFDGVSYAGPRLGDPVSVIVTDRRGLSGLALPAAWPAAPAWSPDGRRLAFTGPGGLSIADVRSGRTRVLTRERAYRLAWSTDGRSLAYVSGGIDYYQARSGDLRTVTLAGRRRTIVRADRAYGGRIVSVAWARAPAGVRYRRPAPAPAVPVAPTGLLAAGPIEELAADGNRVAFAACQQVSVWTPADGTVVSIPASDALPGPVGSEVLDPASCRWVYPYSFYALALAGERVAWGWQRHGGNSSEWNLYAATVSPASLPTRLAGDYATSYIDWRIEGDLVGSAGLLAFSRWLDACTRPGCSTYVTKTQDVMRVDGLRCPCATVATSPGALVPFDVADDRIVAGGDNATWILDAQGKVLLSVPVSPLAAQLDSRDLVVVVRGELRDYDASSGALLHSWPYPEVAGGADFATPRPRANSYGWLQDAARGLVAYLDGGQLHVLRLADGATATIAPATFGRFIDAGLVYADGARITLVPYDQLPLR